MKYILLPALAGAATQTLREAAQGTGMYMGGSVNQDWLEDHPDDYAKLAASEFDLTTAGNSCKMYAIAKKWAKSNWDYSKCQYIIDWSKKNNMKMRGHVLVWANQLKHSPKWTYDWTDPVKIETLMKNYITTTVKQFGDELFAWDVVNEAIDPYNGKGPLKIRDTNIWSKVDDFICIAFKTAHRANPRLQLFYNDYGMSGNKLKSDAVFNLVSNLVQRGCPIHGVGFQSHIDINWSKDEEQIYLDDLKRYGDLGLIVHVTELDVACTSGKKACPYSDSYDTYWPDEALQKQADVYGRMIDGCLKADNCESFEVWGFSDNRTWLDPGQNPTIFNTKYEAKPAYDMLLQKLQNHKKNKMVVKEMVDFVKEEEPEAEAFLI